MPLFDLKENETVITKEVCGYIRNKKHCIPKTEQDKIAIAMYLNICEYIEPEEQENLCKMINMPEHYEGIIAQIKNESWEDCEKSLIKELMQTFTLDEISKLLHREKSELKQILAK